MFSTVYIVKNSNFGSDDDIVFLTTRQDIAEAAASIYCDGAQGEFLEAKDDQKFSLALFRQCVEKPQELETEGYYNGVPALEKRKESMATISTDYSGGRIRLIMAARIHYNMDYAQWLKLNEEEQKQSIHWLLKAESILQIEEEINKDVYAKYEKIA